MTMDDSDKKSDSFSSRDSGNESTSGKELESNSSCSPSSVQEHESDAEDCVSGQGSVEDNNKPLFLQVSQYFRVNYLIFKSILHLNAVSYIIYFIPYTSNELMKHILLTKL